MKDAVGTEENIVGERRRFTSAVDMMLYDVADDIIGRQVRGIFCFASFL